MKKIIFLLLLLFTFAAHADDAPPPVEAITQDDIMPYLQDMISLHRQVMALEAPADNSRQILASENLRGTSTKTINYAFDFARAQAGALDVKSAAGDKPAMDEGRVQNLKKVAARVDDHLKQVQDDLDAIGGKINSAKAAERAQLLATRDKMTSELKLAKAQQELIQSILALSSNGGVDEAGLLKRINTLARTVPEIQTEQQRKNAKTDTQQVVAAPQKTVVPTSKGIIGLVSDLYSAFSKHREVKAVVTQNAHLKDESQQLLNKLKTKLKAEVALGDDIAKATPGDGEASLANQKKQLENLVVEFKQLGTSVIPLNQTILWLDAGNKNLAEWDDLISQQMNDALHVLAIRLVMLAIAIVIPVVLSRIAHRTIKKYTRDPRWQRQLQTIRRIVFTAIITMIIVLNLISESGSLLTFAGFLTAGLAVALQNVILSIVAYFFYFGRYGVREGDRVTIGGITGEVIRIGIVRINLMELAGKDFSFYPTGRVVTFPNSILFQPAAFTKLVPGTSFSWSEISVILDPATDYQLASKKLLEAVDLVYDEYKDKIKAQQEALQRSTNLLVQIPGPSGYIKFVDAGLAFVVRYPVQINESSEIHDRITKKLIDAIRAEPGLKLAT